MIKTNYFAQQPAQDTLREARLAARQARRELAELRKIHSDELNPWVEQSRRKRKPEDSK
jgi:hypothetical protein